MAPARVFPWLGLTAPICESRRKDSEKIKLIDAAYLDNSGVPPPSPSSRAWKRLQRNVASDNGPALLATVYPRLLRVVLAVPCLQPL